MAPVAARYFAGKEIGINAYAGRIVFQDGFVFDDRRPDNKLSFGDLVVAAYRERIPLGARGHYATQGIGFDWSVGKGSPFLYFTNGCAVAEVMIDRFTGELKVERVDIVMDIGRSINPMINRGQIIGAYIQGQGWLTTEDLRYSSKGALLSYSPTTYKIPNIYDTPPILNVHVMENECTVNVRGTKAVGEPPLVLGVATWTAVKNALSYVSGDEIATLSTPATGEEILSRLTYYAAHDKELAQPWDLPRERDGTRRDAPVLPRAKSKAVGTALRGKVPKALAAGSKR